MSNENKWNPEINDADLKNVSGGVLNEALNGVNVDGNFAYDSSALDKAMLFCSLCKRDYPKGCHGGSPELLAQRIGGVAEYYLCPFYQGPVG